MGKKLKLTNTKFVFKDSKKPLKNAFIYVDLPESPEDKPKFELSEFKTDNNGKLGFVKKPEGSILLMEGKEYNVYYYFSQVKDFKKISESECQKVKMADVIELEKQGTRKLLSTTKHKDYDITIKEFDEGDGRLSYEVTNKDDDYFEMKFYFEKPKKPQVEIHDPKPKGNATKSKPYVRVVSPGTKDEKFLTYVEAAKTSWNMDFYPGDPNAVHDKKVLYALPYNKGEEYKVIQGFNSTDTHKSPLQHCVDFEKKADEDFIVCASREGVVVETDDSVTGTVAKNLGEPGNFVRILHTDRTYGYYIHLETNSVKVNKGDKVKEDDEIAFADNTGSSSGEHLHFDVRMAKSVNTTKNERTFKTVSWKFKDSGGKGFEPKKGKTYKK